MAERRALIEGLKEIDKDIDPVLAERFIDGKEPHPPETTLPNSLRPKPSEPAASPQLPKALLTAAETTEAIPADGGWPRPRWRPRSHSACRRPQTRSLERQLAGIQPNSIQEILEDAIHLWLLKHGHLD